MALRFGGLPFFGAITIQDNDMKLWHSMLMLGIAISSIMASVMVIDVVMLKHASLRVIY